ncbi:MAG: amidohydrolase, partial [Gemmatimonadota bacterium]|nr:amidohydrolase [Gemmatimonadota bacterium]
MFERNLSLLVMLAAFTTQNAVAQRNGNGGLPMDDHDSLRTVSISTSEGTWMSLDVSPDGQTLVFDLLGDIYTLPISGGEATQFTSGMAFDGQPRFSPDGTKIVFTSDRDGGENVWVMSVDRSDTTQITKGKNESYLSPEWTPDGDYIVASKGGASKPWMYHVEGGSGTQLVREPENIRLIGAAFGAEDRYIWFAGRQGSSQYNARFPQYQLAVYDRDNGELYSRSSQYGSAFRPTLSPDGNWLVYGTRHDTETGLVIRDLSSGDERWLAYPVQRDDQESRASRDVLPGMSFTPDSREVVASYGGKIWRIPVDGSSAVEIPFEVNVDLEVGPLVEFDYEVSDEPTFVAQQIRDIVPSPDGSRIAFVALDKIWIQSYPDGEPVRATDSDLNEHHPAWSPDGRSLVFVTWSDTEGGHIHTTRADRASGSRRITQASGYYETPVWSPDGTRIIAVKTDARNFEEAIARGGANDGSELIWIGATGGPATSITPAGRIARPHFASQSDRIYAFRSGTGLISMRFDGTDVQEHVNVTGATQPGASSPTNASLIMMAPAGDQALAEVGNDIFVVTVPRVGGRTPRISVSNPSNAAFPARKLTVVGGQFPAWESNGRRVHWGVGNVHFAYDLDDAKAFEDSVEAAKKAEKEAEEEEPAQQDSIIQAPVDSIQADSLAAAEEEDEEEEEEDKEYRAVETPVTISGMRDIPQGVVVLRGARVVTMRGDEIIDGADIVVRNNRIEAVGRNGTVAVPEGAEVVDVSGKTIIPGFVDTHAHLRPMYGIHKTQVWSYVANLAYGVTTTRDPQTFTTDVLSYEDQVEAGAILG